MTRKTTPLPVRFFRKVEAGAESGCWLWTGSKNDKGYGKIFTHKTERGTTVLVYAHRASYEMFYGPIPEGLVIDHLCRNRACVNPTHLEAVTQYENLVRGETHVALGANRDACGKGHPYSEHMEWIPARGKWKIRRCRACMSEHSKVNGAKRRARLRAERNAA